MNIRVLLFLLIGLVPLSASALPPGVAGIEIEEMLEDEVSAVAGPVIGPGIPAGPVVLPWPGDVDGLIVSEELLRERPAWFRLYLEELRRRMERISYR